MGRGTARAYQFDCTCPLRNKESHEEDAKKALEDSVVCKGYIPLYLLILHGVSGCRWC